MKTDKYLIVAPPVLMTSMRGVVRAVQDRESGLCTLYYTDGTTESAVLKKSIHDMENFFAIVSDVQGLARQENHLPATGKKG